MSGVGNDLAALAHLLPEASVGQVTAVQPIVFGLSGAGVYGVSATRGEFVLRVNAVPRNPARYVQQLRVLRRAAELGVAPAIVHVDESERAVLSVRIAGPPLHLALQDPAQGERAIPSVVAQLRVLHGADPTGIDPRDPVASARRHHAEQRDRPGFPVWAAQLGEVLDALAATLARDPRLVVSHNDMNPGNVLWDGRCAWLIDWEDAGLAHPFFDLASLAMFLDLPEQPAHMLLALQEQRTLDARDLASFGALRRVAAIACGLALTGLVPDLHVVPVQPPPISEIYASLGAAEFDLQDPRSRGTFAFALIELGLTGGH